MDHQSCDAGVGTLNPLMQVEEENVRNWRCMRQFYKIQETERKRDGYENLSLSLYICDQSYRAFA